MTERTFSGAVCHVKQVHRDNPPDPFSGVAVEYEPLGDPEWPTHARVTLYDDASKQILSKNDSPDIGFRYSVNPYRGCTHACAYCYARPTHEYLSFGSGTDFDTKIVVKRQAPKLLLEAFEKPSWLGEQVVFSGVTDCYQRAEASLQLTRQCLEVCLEYRNPVGIITKSPLIERDVDLLKALVERSLVDVMVSIPLWRREIAQALEPFVATPARRMQTVARLAAAGIPVGVMLGPTIPGLEDDWADILRTAREAGATSAAWVLLRLPGSVKTVFESRLRAKLPLQAEKVLHRITEAHGGKTYDPRFGVRGRGQGPYADALQSLFDATTKRLGFEPPKTVSRQSPFQRPPKSGEQLGLFSSAAT
ncbi:MAG: PA0069 family radical SAM protein [Myxococcaceae bacterium]